MTTCPPSPSLPVRRPTTRGRLLARLVLGLCALLGAAPGAAAQIEVAFDDGPWVELVPGQAVRLPGEKYVGSVFDGGPLLAFWFGAIEEPRARVQGTLHVRGSPRGDGDHEIDCMYGQQIVLPLRRRQFSIPDKLQPFRARLLGEGQGGWVKPVAWLGPDPQPRDLDQTGSGMNIASRVPMFLNMLARRTATVDQLAECDRWVTERGLIGNHYYWLEKDHRLVTAADCHERRWRIGQAYRNQRGGGFSTLYHGVLPEGVGANWGMGKPTGSAPHVTVSQSAMIAAFTGDGVAARWVAAHIEAMMSLYPLEWYEGEARAHGWMLDALAHAGAALGPHDPELERRCLQHVSTVIRRLESFNVEGPRGSVWPVLSRPEGKRIPPTERMLTLGTDAGLTDEEALARCQSVRSFMVAILCSGLCRALDFLALPTELRERVVAQLDIAASCLIDQTGAAKGYSTVGPKVLNEPVDWPDDAGLGTDLPYLKPGNPNTTKGVGARFILPALCELKRHGYDDDGRVSTLIRRVVTRCEQGNWFASKPSSPRIAEWMWPAWQLGVTRWGR